MIPKRNLEHVRDAVRVVRVKRDPPDWKKDPYYWSIEVCGVRVGRMGDAFKAEDYARDIRTGLLALLDEVRPDDVTHGMAAAAGTGAR